ncbi:MAG: GNAT family N-acetyltransferase [Gammaproteobacteria bacterium]
MLVFEPLDRQHDRAAFCCGEPALDGYLLATARQHADKGISRTFVAVEQDQAETIVGYFTLTVAEIPREHLPAKQKRRLPNTDLPVIKLARLAVDSRFQGKGLGGVLLFEALKRAAAAQALTGAVAVIVEAKSERAASFYEQHGFLPLPDTPLSLCMSFAVIQSL